ncbi:MAG: C25 family cysteine peptidase [Ignavibacteriaceae bacterium]
MKRSVFFFVICSFQTILSQTITLRDTTNQYDYIIITVPEFVTACETFRQHKEIVRDFRTLIVDTTQIFAEFDSSETGQDNIRDFISYAGTFWKQSKPKLFLIAGSVQFVPNFNIPDPTGYNSPYWQSDYYFTQNIYENDSTTTDFYVGRIPCKNTAELANYLSKVIDYENNNSLESWMNNTLFVCEDDLTFDFLGSAMSIAENFPPYIREYFIVDSDTSIYYGNKDSIYSIINNRGCSIVWFEGFSSDSSFVSNDYFNLEDLAGLTNDSKYYFTIIPFTQRAIIDSNTNLTNEMLYLSNAGSLGGIVTTGLSYFGISRAFQRTWAQRLFDPAIQSIGETFDLYMYSSGGLFGYMKKITNLWADPSIKLKYDVTVNVDDPEMELPITFALEQNYPNPFNPSTKIRFTIPTSPLNPSSRQGGTGSYQGEGQRERLITLKVYDVLGKEIATLVNEEKPAGTYEVEFDASSLSSGIYFYQLRAGSFNQTKKMLLLK